MGAGQRGSSEELCLENHTGPRAGSKDTEKNTSYHESTDVSGPAGFNYAVKKAGTLI